MTIRPRLEKLDQTAARVRCFRPLSFGHASRRRACLLLFEVRAAPQRFVIHLPAAADASDPTSYPCLLPPLSLAADGLRCELSLDCDKALRAALTKVK